MARNSFSGGMDGRPIPEYSAGNSPDSTANAVSATSRIGRLPRPRLNHADARRATGFFNSLLVENGARNPMLAAHVRHRMTSLLLLQDAGDLLFTEPAALHKSVSIDGRLYPNLEELSGLGSLLPNGRDIVASLRAPFFETQTATVQSAQARGMAPVSEQRSCIETPRTLGFTLVEMMVVLALVGMMAAAFLAVYKGPRSESARLRVSTQEMAGELRMARIQAVLSSTIVRFEFSVAERRYRPMTEDWRFLPEGVRLSLPDMPGRETATLSFHPDGSSSGMRIGLSLGSMAKEIEVGALTGSIVDRSPE